MKLRMGFFDSKNGSCNAAVEIYRESEPITTDTGIIQRLVFSKENRTAIARKLLALPDGDGTLDRIGATCSKANIYVFQGATTPLPNGIPTYTVQVENACLSGSCSISDIHLRCGWFSSARLINPSIFRRVCYDDCLVNNGEPLEPGESLSFQYANSFQYPLSVSSVSCY
ncbi:hypothetical protein RJ640_010170 [Escallonia rubra]|uniref:Uncharacterized protein n=1 Tax=Escallonia rubra TaxID=112253 RepID=A0AA88UBG4_9ASTE|nr:hypothetical protein RJ640_010170 [Escallonia rubra]